MPSAHVPELSHQPCKPSSWEPAPKHSIAMATTYPSGPNTDLTVPSSNPPSLSWGDQGSLWQGVWGSETSERLWQETSQEEPA